MGSKNVYLLFIRVHFCSFTLVLVTRTGFGTLAAFLDVPVACLKGTDSMLWKCLQRVLVGPLSVLQGGPHSGGYRSVFPGSPWCVFRVTRNMFRGLLNVFPWLETCSSWISLEKEMFTEEGDRRFAESTLGVDWWQEKIQPERIRHFFLISQHSVVKRTDLSFYLTFFLRDKRGKMRRGLQPATGAVSERGGGSAVFRCSCMLFTYHCTISWNLNMILFIWSILYYPDAATTCKYSLLFLVHNITLLFLRRYLIWKIFAYLKHFLSFF